MRHKMHGRKLNRTSAHRKALLENLAAALIEHGQIKTTLPKAKELRPFVEHAITVGRANTLQARRRLIQLLRSKDAAVKVLDQLSPRYQSRPGGYTRIIKAGFRYGDNAPMAVIEFVDRPEGDMPMADLKSAEAAS
jgi:large subunit ribosomal protein L17